MCKPNRPIYQGFRRFNFHNNNLNLSCINLNQPEPLAQIKNPVFPGDLRYPFIRYAAFTTATIDNPGKTASDRRYCVRVTSKVHSFQNTIPVTAGMVYSPQSGFQSVHHIPGTSDFIPVQLVDFGNPVKFLHPNTGITKAIGYTSIFQKLFSRPHIQAASPL